MPDEITTRTAFLANPIVVDSDATPDMKAAIDAKKLELDGTKETTTITTKDETPNLFKFGEESFTNEQLTEKFTKVNETEKKFNDGVKELDKITPLLKAIQNNDKDEINKVIASLTTAKADTTQKETTSTKASDGLTERVAALESEKALVEEDKQLNKVFDTAATDLGQEFTDNEDQIIDYMKANKIHWSQVKMAFHAFKAENADKMKTKESAGTLMNSPRSVKATTDTNWIKKDSVETAYEAAQRLNLKLDI